MHLHSQLHLPHFAVPHKKRMLRSEDVRCDKAIREHLSEAQIDKMLRDSFPASDPPSVY